MPPMSLKTKAQRTREEPAARTAVRYAEGVAIVLVGVAAALVRILLLVRYPFDGLYGQDPYFYLSATHQLERIWTIPPGSAPGSLP